MKIILDAMGGDNAPEAPVLGAIEAAKAWGSQITLVGRGEEILAVMKKNGIETLPDGMEIAHADDVVDMYDDPANVVRKRKNSSMIVGLKMLSEDRGDAFVSAGSTGALLSGATLVVKRVKGIRRAAMGPAMPNKAGGKTVICDCGANAECSPEFLLQFALLGSLAAKKTYGIENPRVGLLNIGAEPSKGDTLRQETYQKLQALSESGAINFVGNVEPKAAMFGGADVIVADGFAGNVMLKTMEAVGSFVGKELKAMFKKNPLTMLSALLVKGGIAAFKDKMDPNKVGGTAILGISKPVIKAHGSSNAEAICNAIRQAAETAEADIAGEMTKNIHLLQLEKED